MKQAFTSADITEKMVIEAILKTGIGSPGELAAGSRDDLIAVAYALGAQRVKEATLETIRAKALRMHERILRTGEKR